jgi:hypothetical protein
MIIHFTTRAMHANDEFTLVQLEWESYVINGSGSGASIFLGKKYLSKAMIPVHLERTPSLGFDCFLSVSDSSLQNHYLTVRFQLNMALSVTWSDEEPLFLLVWLSFHSLLLRFVEEIGLKGLYPGWSSINQSFSVSTSLFGVSQCNVCTACPNLWGTFQAATVRELSSFSFGFVSFSTSTTVTRCEPFCPPSLRQYI